MKRLALFVLFAAATLGACTQAPPEQQIVNDAAAALGGSEKIQAVKTIVIEGEGTNGNLGQDMTPDATGQLFNRHRLQARHGCRGRTRADRADAHAELHLLPGPAAAEAGARRRRRRRLQRGAKRHGHARRRCGREGSPRGELSPSDYHHPRGARSRRQAVEPEDPGQPERGGYHDGQRAHVHAGDRQHDEAADACRLDDRQHEPRRRRDRDELRRLSGCQRPQAAGAVDNQDRQVPDRGSRG